MAHLDLQILITETINKEINFIFESFKDAQRIFSQETNDAQLVSQTIEQFKTLKKQNKIQNNIDKDISKWVKRGWPAFHDFVNQASKQKSIKQVKTEGAFRAYEDQKYLIVVPLTKEASIYYGRGTKWCTSAAQSTNFFRDYFLRQKAVLFYTINKQNGDKFVAVYYTTKNHFDLIDAEHNFIDEKDFPFKPDFFRSLYEQHKKYIETVRTKQSPKKTSYAEPPEISTPSAPSKVSKRRRIVDM